MARKKKNDGGVWWMPYVWCAVFGGCIWYGLAHDGLWQGVKLCGAAFGCYMALFWLYWCIFTPSGRKATFDIPADKPTPPEIPYWDRDEGHTEEESGYKSGYDEGYDDGYDKGREKADDTFLLGDGMSAEKIDSEIERLRLEIVGTEFPDNLPDDYFDAYKKGYKAGRRDGYKEGLCDGYEFNKPMPKDTGGAWVPGIGIGSGIGGGIGGG